MKSLTTVSGLLLALTLFATGCATHSMTFRNGPSNRTVTQVHDKPMHLSLFNGMLEPNSVRLDAECGADDWVRIDQDDSYVNRMVADQTDNTITPKSITIHCGPYDQRMPAAPAPAPVQGPTPPTGPPGAGY